MASAALSPVAAPAWSIVYQGVNITADVSAMVLELEYQDQLSGLSGSAQVTFEDRDGRWRDAWRPERGDSFTLALGYAGEMLDCGDFQVDEVSCEGVPDVVHLRGLETHITPDLRTERSLGYENVSLMQIAGQVAARHGLTLVGAPANLNVTYSRVTQKRETDLRFLHRLAAEHGYEFSIRGAQMVFHARAALETQAPILTVERGRVTHYSFKFQSLRTHRAASLTYQDPATKSLVSATAAAQQDVKTGDTMRPIQRVENAQQAAARAAAQLHRENSRRNEARITMPGDRRIVGGAVLALSGFGAGDGNYLVERATHRIARDSGYTVEIEMRSAAQ